MKNTIYTQHIHSLEIVPVADNFENVVIRVSWEIIARRGIHVCSQTIVSELDNVQNQEHFVSFEDLTESLVLDWVTAIEPVAQIQKQLAAQLDEKINNPIEKVMPPWGQSADWRNKLFVLVHNDEIMWGPSRWNADVINQILKQNDITAVFDKSWLSVPQTPALQIADNTWLYVAKEHWDKIDDSLFYTHAPVDWQFSESDGAVGTHSKIQRPLEEIKQTMITGLTPNADSDLFSGSVSVNISGTNIEIPKQHLSMYVCGALIENPDNLQLQIIDINGKAHAVSHSYLKQALAQLAVTALSPSPPKPNTETAMLIAQIEDAESLSELIKIQQEKQ